MSLGTSGGQTATADPINPEAIAERTTVGVFFRQAARYGDRALVHYPSGQTGIRRWEVATWADLRRNTLAVASALIEAGVKAGDHVVLMSENRLEWLYCDLGILSAGAITVPIYPSTVAGVAQRIAANCGAVLAITSGNRSGDRTAGKLETNSVLRRVATMDEDVPRWVAETPGRLDEVRLRLEKIGPEDVCTIVYTSGTTGEPKGAELAHRSIVDMGLAVLQLFPLSEEDSSLSFLPYSHVLERINGTFTGLMFGGQSWISHGTDHLTEDLAEVQPTVMISVPRVYEKMHAAVMDRVREAPSTRQALFRWAVGVGTRFANAAAPGALLRMQHRIADRLVLHPLRMRLVGGRLRFFISGGAALSREVEQFFWAIGVPILNGWGLTETSSGACSNTLSHHRFLTVGRPFPGVQLKIAEDGEILVDGPGNMIGYHNNPAATAEMLRDGWIHTGDIGELDADGYLKITDRKKDLIKTAGGKYVAPQPLEFQLMQDELVEQAVVIGEGMPYVTALIVPDWNAVIKRGFPGRPNDLARDERVISLFKARVDEVNKALGSWETIKYFSLLPRAFSEEEGEMTPTLKIKRRVISERYGDEIESMYTGRKKPS